MKFKIRKFISCFLCVSMICMTFMQTTYAKPGENEPSEPEYEYDIEYRSIGEDDGGFTAQFTIINYTEQAITDWTLDFDYNMPIEQPDNVQMSVTKNKEGAQFKYHYQLKGNETTKAIAPKSELLITYQVKQPLNTQDTPQNYKFAYQKANPSIEITLNEAGLEKRAMIILWNQEILRISVVKFIQNFRLKRWNTALWPAGCKWTRAFRMLLKNGI